MKELSHLSQAPEGWREEIVSEEDPAISPESWRLGQVGMVGNVIKPIDQEGVDRGMVRVIFVDTNSLPQHREENFREDLLG